MKDERIRQLKDEKTIAMSKIKEMEDALSTLDGFDKDVIKFGKPVNVQNRYDIGQKSDTEEWKGKLHKPTIPTLMETSFDEWKVEAVLKSGIY